MISVTSNSSAIRLLVRPKAARASTWRSRGVNDSGHRVEHLLLAERFGQEIDGARLHRLHGHRDITVASHEDDRDVDGCLGQLDLKVEPTRAWQPDIEHQQLATFGRRLFRNSVEEPNAATRRPTDLKRLVSDSRAALSSSTTKTMGSSSTATFPTMTVVAFILLRDLGITP